MIDGLGEGKVEGSGDREGSRIRRREEGRSRNRVLFFFVVWMCLCFFFFVLEGKGWDGMEWNGYPVLECGWVEGGVCISLAFHLLSIFF